MKRLLTLMMLAGLAGIGYLMREELTRYLRIVRMDQNPALVGENVTPQGNAMALQRDEPQRAADRRPGGVAPGRVVDAGGRWAG